MIRFVYECPDCGNRKEFARLPLYPPVCCGWVMKRVGPAQADLDTRNVDAAPPGMRRTRPA